MDKAANVRDEPRRANYHGVSLRQEDDQTTLSRGVGSSDLLAASCVFNLETGPSKFSDDCRRAARQPLPIHRECLH